MGFTFLKKELEQDPELLDDEFEGVGGDVHYDNQAVETTFYDPSQFEVAEDFDVEDDEDE